MHDDTRYGSWELVRKSNLIVWDETPMMSKKTFETLDHNIREVMKCYDGRVFGGTVVVFGGDF